MILVDILIPALDSCFDFELNEDVKTGDLLKKVKELLSEKVRKLLPEHEKLYFFAFYQGRLLDEECTLKEQGVVTGERLFLI